MKEYKKDIQSMADKIGIPQEAIDKIFEGPKELESFSYGEVATFNEFINAPEGTEFVTVCFKDEGIRTVSQCVPRDMSEKEIEASKFKDPDNDDFTIEKFPAMYLMWSDSEGSPSVPYTDIDAKMENVGNYIGRWTYTVYHVKL